MSERENAEPFQSSPRIAMYIYHHLVYHLDSRFRLPVRHEQPQSPSKMLIPRRSTHHPLPTSSFLSINTLSDITPLAPSGTVTALLGTLHLPSNPHRPASLYAYQVPSNSGAPRLFGAGARTYLQVRGRAGRFERGDGRGRRYAVQ